LPEKKTALISFNSPCFYLPALEFSP
jgi:hypothetical protein